MSAPLSDCDPRAHATFEREVLTYGKNAGLIFAAVEADPDCPLVNAYAGLAHIFRSTREGLAKSAPFVARARMLAKGANARDRLMIAAVGAWSEEDLPAARLKLTELLVGHPGDLFAAKLLQLLQFGGGDVAGMLRTSAAVLPYHPTSAIAHGMHAFALDQNGREEAAERAARTALNHGPDPWAHHALAHVLDQSGRAAEGRAWMRSNAADWQNCTSFLYTHNWWHAALFEVALGDHDGALALYEERVWAMRRDYCQDQINAVSLLARLELAGVSVGERWSDVASFVRDRRFDAIDGFLDLHYAFALARAGDDDAVADMKRCARQADVASGPRWRRLMPAAIAGLVAFARGQLDEAAALLGPIEPQLYLLGGSTVQRDLFRRVLLAARAGGQAPLARAA